MTDQTEINSRKSKILFFYEKYMLLVGNSGQLLFYLQAAKIFSAMSAADISLPGFSLGFLSVFSWSIYGLLINNMILVISNVFALIGAAFVLIGIIMYS